MGGVIDIFALVLIVVALSAMLRYELIHFENTFSGWGASHYARLSGTVRDRKHS